MIEPLLLATTQISTFDGARILTAATGFFFERNARLHLVTSRHVVFDAPSDHHPSRIEFTVHTDAFNMSAVAQVAVPLYRDGVAVWHQGCDSSGEVDVAVLPIDRAALPHNAVLHCFAPSHLLTSLKDVEVGAPLLIPGFPLGFHDALHHLPVVRQACVASSFGTRFQGLGMFLTDARTHRGSSGAPVVMRNSHGVPPLPWLLLGVHSSRMDMRDRDMQADESLGLNCAWYADILMTLTEPAAPASARPG